MRFREFQPLTAPPWLQGAKGTAWLRAVGDAKDSLVDRCKRGVKARMPLFAPTDALGAIGDERGIPRSPGESDASYAGRLVAAWETWAMAGSPRGVLGALSAAGYGDAHLLIARQLDFSLDASGELQVAALGPGSWDIDNQPAFWSQFQVLLPYNPTRWGVWAASSFSGLASGQSARPAGQPQEAGLLTLTVAPGGALAAAGFQVELNGSTASQQAPSGKLVGALGAGAELAGSFNAGQVLELAVRRAFPAAQGPEHQVLSRDPTHHDARVRAMWRHRRAHLASATCRLASPSSGRPGLHGERFRAAFRARALEPPMTTPYNGNPDAVTARVMPAIPISVDADNLNAELLNTPVTTLADVVAFLQAYGALLGTSRPNNDTLTANGNGDTVPALQTAGPSAATTYKLIHEMAGFDAVQRRRYIGLTDGAACIVDTVNAYWNGATWVRDTDQSDAVQWRVGGGQAQFQVWKVGGSGWAGTVSMSGDQGAGAIGLQDGGISIFGTSAGGYYSSNPMMGVAAANRLVAKNICKAWGTIQLGAPPFWIDGFNVQSPLTIVSQDSNPGHVCLAYVEREVRGGGLRYSGPRRRDDLRARIQ